MKIGKLTRPEFSDDPILEGKLEDAQEGNSITETI